MSEQAQQATQHARSRSAQRAIREQQINLIIQFGRRYHKAGAIFCFFGDREARRHTHLSLPVRDSASPAAWWFWREIARRC